MSPRTHLRRNPGPAWGGRFLEWAERCWPRPIFRGALMAGVWVALLLMPVERRHSRAYLAVVLGRKPRWREVWRHFLSFTDVLLLKLRIGVGATLRGRLAPEHAAEFEALVQSDRPALFGSFHFGHSDLLGFLLGARGRRVTMIRLRVDNSTDIEWLGRQFGTAVSFLWINDPRHLFFELKAALESGQSLAMKCDRLEFSARVEPFEFLGGRRLWPFTIYHLAILFDRPVVFCLGLPGEAGETLVATTPVFTPDAAASREDNLAAARDHFQAVLTWLETFVRQRPFLWFNFQPLPPEAPPSASVR